MKEPFVFGKAVRGEYFTDRKEETFKLVNNFKYGVNTIIISPRRYGKTSLVKHAIANCKDKDLKIVFIDIFASRNPEEFCRMFADAVIKQTSSKIEEWADITKKFLSNLAPKISISADPMNEISLSFGVKPDAMDMENILDLPEKIAKNKKCKIVVCIDEFQQIGEYPDSLYFQRKLRSHWQHHEHTSYCLFGSKKHMMKELFEKSNFPFYKFGDLFYLDKIAEDDWVEYITSRFRSANKEIREAVARDICRLTDNYSSYVQQLSWLLWIRFEEGNQEEILQKAFNEMLAHSSVLFEQITQNLTAYQMNFLRAIIDGVSSDFSKKEILEKYDLGTAGNIAKLKNALIKKEIIDYSNGRYFIADPILKVWLSHRLR